MNYVKLIFCDELGDDNYEYVVQLSDHIIEEIEQYILQDHVDEIDLSPSMKGSIRSIELLNAEQIKQVPFFFPKKCRPITDLLKQLNQNAPAQEYSRATNNSQLQKTVFILIVLICFAIVLLFHSNY
jgi:hypothetical protein